MNFSHLATFGVQMFLKEYGISPPPPLPLKSVCSPKGM